MIAPTFVAVIVRMVKSWKYDWRHGARAQSEITKSALRPRSAKRLATKFAALSLPGVPARRPASARLARYSMSRRSRATSGRDVGSRNGWAVGGVGREDCAHAAARTM